MYIIFNRLLLFIIYFYILHRQQQIVSSSRVAPSHLWPGCAVSGAVWQLQMCMERREGGQLRLSVSGGFFFPSHPRLLFLSVDVVPRPGKNAHVRQTCLFLVFLFYCVLLWQRGRAGPGRLNSLLFAFGICLPPEKQTKKQEFCEKWRRGGGESIPTL